MLTSFMFSTWPNACSFALHCHVTQDWPRDVVVSLLSQGVDTLFRCAEPDVHETLLSRRSDQQAAALRACTVTQLSGVVTWSIMSQQ
jgi:hypothetical protein